MAWEGGGVVVAAPAERMVSMSISGIEVWVGRLGTSSPRRLTVKGR